MNYKNIKEEEEVGNKVGYNFFKTSDTPETTDKATNPALKGRYILRLGAAFPNLRLGIAHPNLSIGIALPNLSMGAVLPNKL
jgi:hypothetical protein